MGTMTPIDYHGITLEEALIKAHDTVGQYRAVALRSGPQDIEFITGHGVIRQELVKLLQSYGLTPRSKIGNTGVIICTIE